MMVLDVCGDGECSPNESCQSCYADCRSLCGGTPFSFLSFLFFIVSSISFLTVK